MLLSCCMTTWIFRGLSAAGLSVLVKYILEDKSTKPNVTFAGWIINMVLWPMFILQPNDAFRALDLDKLKAKAVEKTGLSDFGDWDEVPYREAIELVNKKNYSPLGKYCMYNFFVERLTVTLQIKKTFKENKTLQEYCNTNPIIRPCFIIGMPRTGTTFLHHLLSLDPAIRAPLAYELDYPVPRIPEDPKKDKAARIEQAEHDLKRMELIAPHLIQSHALSATHYEECSHVIVNDVPVRPNTFIFRTKETTDIVLKWNWVKVYQNYYKVLQLLEYFHLKSSPNETVAKRWVLKAPIHLGFLDELVKAFPDADIIWCHRDPASNMISVGTMFRAIEDIFLNAVDLLSMGPGYFAYTNTMFKRADETLKQNSNISCMHVKYSEFVPDPIGMIDQIYHRLGYEFSDEYRDILTKYIDADKLKRKELRKNDTRIPVTLETFGSSQDKIDQRLGWYIKKYLSPTSNASVNSPSQSNGVHT